MTHVFFELNWLAILAASLSHFCLAGFWFVVLVAKPYAAALGIADRPPQKPGPLLLIGPFVCSTITITTPLSGCRRRVPARWTRWWTSLASDGGAGRGAC